jgi:hypothetical protein
MINSNERKIMNSLSSLDAMITLRNMSSVFLGLQKELRNSGSLIAVFGLGNPMMMADQ